MIDCPTESVAFAVYLHPICGRESYSSFLPVGGFGFQILASVNMRQLLLYIQLFHIYLHLLRYRSSLK